MYRVEFPQLRSPTRWVSRLLLAGSMALVACNADGTNEKGLYPAVIAGPGGVTLFFAGSPAWSPDGKTIAFVTHNQGPYWMMTVPSDGGATAVLTPAGISDQYPAWN